MLFDNGFVKQLGVLRVYLLMVKRDLVVSQISKYIVRVQKRKNNNQIRIFLT